MFTKHRLVRSLSKLYTKRGHDELGTRNRPRNQTTGGIEGLKMKSPDHK